MRRLPMLSLALSLIGAFMLVGVAVAAPAYQTGPGEDQTGQGEMESQIEEQSGPTGSELGYSEGFAQLYDMLPEAVGLPVGSETTDAIGNVMQQTTNGLLVWHNVDNVVNFTDGSQTWVLSPLGLMARSNDERFEFEIMEAQIEQELEQQIDQQDEMAAPDLSSPSGESGEDMSGSAGEDMSGNDGGDMGGNSSDAGDGSSGGDMSSDGSETE